MDEHTPQGDRVVELIPQPQGGALLPPANKGECRNPWGRPSRRTELAWEIARRAGLDELVDLARKVRRRPGAIADALINAATDPSSKAQIPAQRLLWDLLGLTREGQEAKAKLDVEVRYSGKVRLMDPDDTAEADFTIKAQEPTNGNGHA